MCALMLLLIAGAADCARPHLLKHQGYPLEHRTSPDYELRPLLPIRLSRDTHHERLVKTNRPSNDSDSFAKQSEVREKHVPRLRTNVNSSQGIEKMRDYGVKMNNNNRDAFHAALQEPAKKRTHETAVKQNEPNETTSVNKFNPSDNGDEEESTWVWGTGDTSEATNTTAVDDLDDRTSIAGANCPTGQVKIDGKCVEKH